MGSVCHNYSMSDMSDTKATVCQGHVSHNNFDCKMIVKMMIVIVVLMVMNMSTKR